jgi:Ca2+-binding EF-hand superfamily protein
MKLIAAKPQEVVDALPAVVHRGLADSVMERLSREVDPRAMMKALDKDGDGQISLQEWQQYQRATFKAADLDGNNMLSAREFESLWFRRDGFLPAMQRLKQIEQGAGAGGAGIEAAQELGKEEAEASASQLRKLAILAAVPFVIFGFLDNAIMIMAGDQIEANLGVTFGLGTLACAGLGNTLSDVIGQLSGGLVEKGASRIGLPNPKMSVAQMGSQKAKLVGLMAGTLGIAFGCLLGMVPLLFIDDDEKNFRRIFSEIDEDANGTIDESELVHALRTHWRFLGVGFVYGGESQARRVISNMDTDHDGVISEDEFVVFMKRFKSHGDETKGKAQEARGGERGGSVGGRESVMAEER